MGFNISIDIALVLIIFMLLSLLTNYLGATINNMWLSYGIYIYAIMAVLFLFRSSYHRFRWFVITNPIKLQCGQCQTIVSLTRYGEERFLTASVNLYVETIKSQLFRIKQYYYLITYRPYLQFDCPSCGTKSVICPYCHEPISPDLIECNYDKPSKCPHCGKKIYTPLPLMDNKNLIYIQSIAE